MGAEIAKRGTRNKSAEILEFSVQSSTETYADVLNIR